MFKLLALLSYALASFAALPMDGEQVLVTSKKVNTIVINRLDDEVEKQITNSVNLLKEIFGECLLGVYLYGSAVVGGLQKHSDIDLFVVLERPTTSQEKARLTKRLLIISGEYKKSKTRCIEMTIVVKDEVSPWHYPPFFDFQYGEWLRKQFEEENFEPWTTKEMPDLALLITQVFLANKILFGPNPDQILSKVPYKDFILATKESLNNLITDIKSDTENVLLTLARIWNTVSTNTIVSKSNAAAWAIDQIPAKYNIVLKRAGEICIGETKDYWGDLEALIQPCANFMLNEINKQMSLIEKSNKDTQYIKLGSKNDL